MDIQRQDLRFVEILVQILIHFHRKLFTRCLQTQFSFVGYTGKQLFFALS